MTFPELAAVLKGLDPSLPPYRAEQIFSLTARGRTSFEEMTVLPRSLRMELGKRFCIRGSRISGKLEDRDGTVKLRFALADGAAVEAVLIGASRREEAEGRWTACLSTQAGCPVGCVFCKTGALGFLRNLEAWEIVDQFLALADFQQISNIVVMGMGEPLLNLPALRKALEILCDPRSFGFSGRRITVSTSGMYRGILDMAENGPRAELALSLTTAREELRRRLMPGTAGNPLGLVREALRLYRKKQGRRITLEAVLLGGINTSAEDARAMIDFAGGLDAGVNLIPWNPAAALSFEGEKLREPRREEIEAFCILLEKGGLRVTRRRRRGRGISGACGQLGSAGNREPAADL